MKSLFDNSKKSIAEYYLWRKSRAKEFINFLTETVSLKDEMVLDVGCGLGALSVQLAKCGPDVTAIETNKETLDMAIKFSETPNIKFIQADGKNLPFNENSFDIVVLFYVLEHVKNLNEILSECKRVLKEDGFLCVEFPPYYSIIGHHAYRFTLLPIQYLPKKFVRKYLLSKKPKDSGNEKLFELPDVPVTPEDAYNTFITLNKITISKFRKLTGDMQIKDEKFIFKYPGKFSINIKLLKYMPLIKEIFSMSYFAVLQKRHK